MKFSSKLVVATAALGLSLAATGAVAQSAMAPAPAGSSMSPMGKDMMHNKKHDNMMMNNKMAPGSMHMMPATVSAVDTKTGMVDVTTDGMSLHVHFPPKSVANLKVGDKITLHMGFSK